MSAPSGATTGVLVMSYGSPRSPEEVESYYTDIRRGRPPSPEQLADLRRRYDAIGGVSPLAERTAAQVAAVERALELRNPGRYRVWSGTKHGSPRLEEAVGQIAAAGLRDLVGIVLAPHYSSMSVGEYVERAGRAAAAGGIAARFVLSWHAERELIELLATRVEAALAEVRPRAKRVTVVVTAHSLPERIVAAGDPYPALLAETAGLLAARCGLEGSGVAWRVGWQSAGRTSEPWIGPDILDTLRQLAGEGVDGVVVCAAGFTSDHLEVLYDLDVDARRLAGELGLAFARTASLNDDPGLATLIARLVDEAAGVAAPGEPQVSRR